jgi:hypothetical protein
MGFIDLFRPKWRHSDSDVRAEAVRNLGADQLGALAQVAQKDKDARVRRIAVKRLDDPAVLTAIASSDPDESIRELAGEKASGLRVAAALVDGPSAERAVGELRADRDLAEVARRAARAEARRLAVARMNDAKALAEVVRKSDDQDIRLAALGRIRDAALLADLAASEETKAVALAALERVTDPAALATVAREARAKAARNAARDRLPREETPGLAEVPTAPMAPRAQEKTRRAKLLQLTLAAEAVAQRSDWEHAAQDLAELRTRFAEVESGGHDEALVKRFEAAQHRFAERREHDAQQKARAAAEAAAKKAKADAQRRAAEKAAAAPAAPAPAPAPVAPEAVAAEAPAAPRGPALPDRLAALVLEAERNVGGKPSAARLADLERRWKAADEPDHVEPEVAALRERYETARAELARRVDEERQKREAEVAAARAKLEKAAEELERRAEKTDVKGGEAAVRAAQALLKAPGDDTVKARVRAAIDKVGLKLGEAREADSWKRFAAVPTLEALCQEAEALAAVLADVEDKRRAPALLKDLQARWKAAGPAPKEKHDALWTRFKAACDAVYEKSKEFFGKLDEERAANLVKKEALVAQVEALKDSTEWKDTSEAVKKLQEEWKAIGYVDKEKGDEVWKRFRAACDHFFDRRAQNDKSRDEERVANQARKEALIARIEGLASSTEWRQAADAIKAAQEDWQATGPAPRAVADELWRRFRAACDTFFAARKVAFEKADVDRQENLAKKLLLCEKVEALSAADDNEAALAAVKELQAEWKTVGPVPKEQSDELWRRFRAACDVVYSGPQTASVSEIAAATQSGVTGFANRLPLEGLVARLQSEAPAPAGAPAAAAPPAPAATAPVPAAAAPAASEPATPVPVAAAADVSPADPAPVGDPGATRPKKKPKKP